ncbi:hypothetical protein PTSG_04916 [Salpingoeca rosetta]|uniref:Uncharacterized protein n=1 Tax=Salpingoeca rosetta (strain ATCC 50818 / BSB-021) TaxID=946362 RepID=F2U8Z9_SALR5|nr:uncharacterized protein PTSG_04916 [Salpingoeca rosetta]EGD73202.1 hypothetical protein PTSG_04916 [Salpingoeca rosetta]|eukprot:XP_004994233.1 hypothetical protein PTSG_04916 [Salpingoeca rosetta]
MSATSTPPKFDLRTLLEQHCALACNPSSLQQRLVIGGRNTPKYEAKMLRHKQDCMMGCAFAAQSDVMTRVEDQTRVAQLVKDLNKESNTILDSSQMREKRNKIQDWFIMMRLQCSQKCDKACEARGDTDYKCARSCAVGCDKFFDKVFAD